MKLMNWFVSVICLCLSAQAADGMPGRAEKLISALIEENAEAVLQLSDGDLYYWYKHPSDQTFRVRREYGRNYRILHVREFHRFQDGETIFCVRCDFAGRQIDFMVYSPLNSRFFTRVVDLGTVMPEPTREQLYADFDYLAEMIEKFSPRTVPNRYLYHLNLSEKLAVYRRRISEIHSLVDYTALVEAALQACKGNHLWIANDLVAYLDNPENALSEIVENGYLVVPEAIPVSYFLKRCLWQSSPERPRVPLVYCRGNYYLKHDLLIGSKRYLRGMRLLAVNGKPVGEVLARVQDALSDFDWDRKCFFGNHDSIGDDFYCCLPEWQSESVALTFEHAGKQKTILLKPDAPETIRMEKPKVSAGCLPPTVCYLPEHQVLYIRIPEMEKSRLDFYLSRIREEVSEQEVKAAVIDIRNNPGGSDWAWTKLLALLQTGRENDLLIYAVNDNPDVLHFIARRQFSKTDEQLSPKELETVSLNYFPLSLACLGGASFLATKETYPPISGECLFPESLPVYLLVQDVYSSAGNLAALARRSEKITSVGFDNPRDIGQGKASILFSLPHSKLIIRTNVWTDFSNCRVPEDCAHVRVEVPVKLTPEQLVEYHNLEVGDDLSSFLTGKDPFMKKVFELITSQH